LINRKEPEPEPELAREPQFVFRLRIREAINFGSSALGSGFATLLYGYGI
jgi:hypothetical protein